MDKTPSGKSKAKSPQGDHSNPRGKRTTEMVVRRIELEQISESPGERDLADLEMLLDVPVEVSVELGRTRKLLREVMSLGPGSVVELDKTAGEPVEVFVNGYLVARGEVVVIDENFGIRICEIQARS